MRDTAARTPEARTKALPSPLAGKVFDETGEPLYAQGNRCTDHSRRQAGILEALQGAPEFVFGSYSRDWSFDQRPLTLSSSDGSLATQPRSRDTGTHRHEGIRYRIEGELTLRRMLADFSKVISPILRRVFLAKVSRDADFSNPPSSGRQSS